MITIGSVYLDDDSRNGLFECMLSPYNVCILPYRFSCLRRCEVLYSACLIYIHKAIIHALIPLLIKLSITMNTIDYCTFANNVSIIINMETQRFNKNKTIDCYHLLFLCLLNNPFVTRMLKCNSTL